MGKSGQGLDGHMGLAEIAPQGDGFSICGAGFVKLITDPDTDQVLGAQAVGPHATDLIAEAALAIQTELTAKELARTIHAHPTFSEAWAEAAHMALGHGLHSLSHKRKAADKT